MPFYNDFLQFLRISLVLEGSATSRSEENLSVLSPPMASARAAERGCQRSLSPTEPSPAHLDVWSLLSFQFKSPSQAHAFEHLGSASDTVLGNRKILGV